MDLNSNLKERFLTLIENKKVSHSYIIAGGEGAGKLDFALYCAKALLCGGKPCGKCDDCRKAEKDSHPDIIVINRGETQSFKIDEVRRVTESIYVPPNASKKGSKKIYILDHCENMTVQAQNALLKAFEEPPEYVVFFILTEKKEALLPTVRSRASLFTVSPVERSKLEEALKKKYPKETDENINNAVRLSEGFFGRAVKFLEKSSKEEIKVALSLANYILFEKSGYKTAVLLNGYKNKREAAVRILFLVLYAVRDTVLYKNGDESFCLLSLEDAERFSFNTMGYLSELSDLIISSAESLENNGNYTSCIAKLCGAI